MIEHISILKIKNGWIITISNKGIFQDTTEDYFVDSVVSLIDWIEENVEE